LHLAKNVLESAMLSIDLIMPGLNPVRVRARLESLFCGTSVQSQLGCSLSFAICAQPISGFLLVITRDYALASVPKVCNF
jgi:hypothetical protein